MTNKETVVNIISGPLSSGKSTAILSLLKQRPQGEKWAVLINESGDVGIDGTALSAMGVPVREIAGGCACCANGVVFRAALIQLVARERPSRVLVEPSGIGETTRLKSMIIATGLSLGATITLIPADVHDALLEKSYYYQDQLRAADVFIITRSDLLQPSNCKKMSALIYAQEYFPPKPIVICQQRGDFAVSILDISISEQLDPLPVTIFSDEDEEEEKKSVVIRFNRGDGLVRHETKRSHRKFVGFVLTKWKIDRDRFLDGLEQSLPLERAKALFPAISFIGSSSSTMKTSFLLNWLGKEFSPPTLTEIPGQSYDKKAVPTVRIQLIFSSSSDNANPSCDYDEDVAAFTSRFESHLSACRVLD